MAITKLTADKQLAAPDAETKALLKLYGEHLGVKFSGSSRNVFFAELKSKSFMESVAWLQNRYRLLYDLCGKPKSDNRMTAKFRDPKNKSVVFTLNLETEGGVLSVEFEDN